MVPKESGFNQSVAASGMCVVQMPHSCYHVETIRHPNSSYVTTKLYGTSTKSHVDATIIRTFHFKKSYFNVSYRRCMPCTLAWRRAGLEHACQSGNIVDFITFRV